MDLFGPRTHPHAAVPAPVPEELRALGERMPPGAYLGTSSWSFPGWRGLVWAGTPDARFLAREGLRAYTAHPLLGLVGVDRSFYRPVPLDDWRRYHTQAHPEAAFLVKAPQAALWARFPDHARWGSQRGRENADFLSPEQLVETAIQPMCAGLPGRTIVVVLQLPPQPINALGGVNGFAKRLSHCLKQVTNDTRTLIGNTDQRVIFAVEPRTPEVLGGPYVRALIDGLATHCVTIHPSMPSIQVQHSQVLRRLPQDAPFVARWMLGVPMPYERAKARYAPFDRIVDAHPKVRRALSRRIRSAVRRGGLAFVSVNNKAEGCAPLTIVGLAEQVVD
jgi:uncharacterized protein YecE (DUF72 family)